MSKKKKKKSKMGKETAVKDRIVLTPEEQKYIDSIPDNFKYGLGDLFNLFEKLENMGRSLANYGDHYIISEENKKGSILLCIFKETTRLCENTFNDFVKSYSKILQNLPIACHEVYTELAKILGKSYQLIKIIEERDRNEHTLS